MTRKGGDVHVSKDGGRWKVTQHGERIATHNTQSNAIDGLRGRRR